MYYTYILLLNDGTYYIGYSSDLTHRLQAHQQNQVRSMKQMNPRLFWYAAFQSQHTAISFEKYLKLVQDLRSEINTCYDTP